MTWEEKRESGRIRFYRYYLAHADRVLARQNQPKRRAAKRIYDRNRYQIRKLNAN